MTDSSPSRSVPLTATTETVTSAQIEVLGWRVMHGDGLTQVERDVAAKLILEVAAARRGEAARSEKATIVHPQNHAEATQRIDECVREIEMIADAFGYDQYEWLAGGKGCA